MHKDSSEKPRLILRVKRRNLADLSGYAMHQRRSGGDRSHIDCSRTHLNRVLIGSNEPASDMWDLIRDIADENLREEVEALRKSRGKKASTTRMDKGPKDPWDSKNAKPWTDLILSASPQWFRPSGNDAGEWDGERLEAFVARAQHVLSKRFGDDLVHLSLHLDEETPHLHAAILPTVVKASKRRGRQRLVSHRQHEAFAEIGDKGQDDLIGPVSSYERLQDEFADAFGDLGLERGERRALAERLGARTAPVRHRTTQEWRLEQAEALDGLEAAQRGAEEAYKVAERREAEAKVKSDALTTGAAALASQEIVYRPPKGGKPDGLVYGPAAQKDAGWRKALAARIRPAGRELVSLARFMHQAVERRVRDTLETVQARLSLLDERQKLLDGREEAIRTREYDVTRDAELVQAARIARNEPREPELAKIVNKSREAEQ
jgi:hypothetical protein